MISFFQHIALECHQGNTSDLSMIHVCLFLCLFGCLMNMIFKTNRLSSLKCGRNISLWCIKVCTRPRSEIAIIFNDTFGQTVDKDVGELWFDLVRKP